MHVLTHSVIAIRWISHDRFRTLKALTHANLIRESHRIDSTHQTQFSKRIVFTGFIMISAIDQIDAETVPGILGCFSRSQHHKRIRTVRRSSGNRRIDNLSTDHIMIIAVHLICPISVKGREYIIFCNLIKLHAHQALQFYRLLTGIDKLCISCNHVSFLKYTIM